MTETNLLEIAERVVGWAGAGVDVEAFAARERETEVRAYESEVESLTVASSVGIGVRVVRDGRQGFAYAAALDDETVRETFDEALDNSRFGSTDEFAGVAEPDGVEPASLDLYRSELVDFATEDKVALAVELEQATLAADPRVTGVESADYADSVYESAVATSRGVAASARETGCYLAAYSLASDTDDTQTGFGFSVGRHPGELSAEKAGADAADRATRLLGAAKAPTRRLTVVLDPYVTARLLGIVGATLSGDAVLKGRSLFADRMHEAVGASSLTLVDDATDSDAFTASTIDAEGLATRRVPLISNGVLQAFLYRHLHGPAGRGLLHRLGGEGRVQGHPRGWCPRPSAHARFSLPTRDRVRHRRRPARPGSHRSSQRRERGVGRLLGGCGGSANTRRREGGAHPGGDHREHDPAAADGRDRGGVGSGVAPHERGRSHPRHRRRNDVRHMRAGADWW